MRARSHPTPALRKNRSRHDHGHHDSPGRGAAAVPARQPERARCRTDTATEESTDKTTKSVPDSALSTELGTTSIADVMVQKIAGLAAHGINGVHSLGGGTARAGSRC